MSKTLTFVVTIPNIPDGMTDDEVQDWLWDSIGHPEDAAYEASVTVEPIRGATLVPAGRVGAGGMTPEVRLSPNGAEIAVRWPGQKYWTIRGRETFEALVSDEQVADWTPLVPARQANPERVGNGCMIFQEPAKGGQ